MAWGREQGCHLVLFNQLARIHHIHPLAGLRHHGQVVGDQQNTQVKLLAQTHQQAQDAGLHGDVQGGGGFVGNQ